MAIAQTIRVSVHGRYLVESPTHGMPAGLLVGFHGYAESAEVQMERLRGIPGASRWMLVSIQGLHRFYLRRTSKVVASWMTRQDRELAIADNLAYVAAVVDETSRRLNLDLPVLLAGFSQGAAMAFRAACSLERRVAGVVAVGGDVPPELSGHSLARVPVVLLARGTNDPFYTVEHWHADQKRLGEAGIDVRAIGLEGGHDWHDAVNREVAPLLG
jgi:predicted esterase